MNQKQLLEQAEKKAGSKANLSKLTGLRLAFFYEWEKGVSMKFDVMVSVLEAIGIKLAAYDTESGMHYEFEQVEKEIVPKSEVSGFVKLEKKSISKERIKRISNVKVEKVIPMYGDCDCVIDEKGLLRKSKNSTCTKNKSQHNF
jgi:hypothetical protein